MSHSVRSIPSCCPTGDPLFDFKAHWERCGRNGLVFVDLGDSMIVIQFDDEDEDEEVGSNPLKP